MIPFILSLMKFSIGISVFGHRYLDIEYTGKSIGKSVYVLCGDIIVIRLLFFSYDMICSTIYNVIVF